MEQAPSHKNSSDHNLMYEITDADKYLNWLCFRERDGGDGSESDVRLTPRSCACQLSNTAAHSLIQFRGSVFLPLSA